MRKNLTLLIAGILLLATAGVAQAQDFSEVKLFTTPEPFAREGGKNEAAGSILLNLTGTMAIQDATIMLHFSVPLAADIAAIGDEDGGVTVTGSANATLTGMAENEDNEDNGTITIDPGTIAGTNLLIQGVMLDVSGADGAVTVTLEATAGMDDFIRIDGPSSALVISDIKVGVEAEAKASTVRTRGTDAGGKMVSLTLKESFKGAFMTGDLVTVDFDGIPKGTTLTAMVTSNPVDSDPTVDGDDDIDDMSPLATVGAVKDGSVTVMLGGMDVDDDDNPRDRPTPTSVTLELTLKAIPPDDDTENLFPLARSSIMAKATFTDPTGLVDNFVDAFTDALTVFNIRPAQCELLFPVVAVLPDFGNWNTAISVTNPAYGDDLASGGLVFTFYGLGSPSTVAVYDTTEDMITGVGLEADGTLSPGGTYQVMANQILAATDWGESFQGHVHLRADYTNCSGLGWVTDFMTVNQAYTATVLDLDTGSE